MKIIIVAGHGGLDCGAVSRYDGTTEREIVKSISKLIHGDIIEYVGVYDELNINQKIKEIEKYNDDIIIVVSIHCNSASKNATGVEGWHKDGDKESKNLSDYIVKNISKDLIMKSRGSKNEKINRHGRLGILHHKNKTIPCLIELGFLSNSRDLYILKHKQKKIAESILDGIFDYLLTIAETKCKEVWAMADNSNNCDKIRANIHDVASIIRMKKII